MFLAWIIGLGLMVVSGWIFYYYHINYGVPYEKFRFESSNEFGLLAPKDWEEYKKFQKLEAKAQVQDVLIGKTVVPMFIVGMVLFGFTTSKFLFRW